MMASAEKRILLLDHSKFGKVALHRLAPLHDFSHIIVDSGIDPTTLQNLKNARLHVEVARV
jgi:DeoR/GlpR family transcriptional regulator of sugar metabolism